MTSLSFSPANRLSFKSKNTLGALKTAPLQTKFAELGARLQAVYEHKSPPFKFSDFFKEAGMNKSDSVSYFKLPASQTHKAPTHPHARATFDQMLVDFVLEQPSPEEFLSHLLQDATTQDVGQFMLGTLIASLDEKKKKQLDVSHFGFEPLNQVVVQNENAASFERLKKFLEENLDENGNLVNKRLQTSLWKNHIV